MPDDNRSVSFAAAVKVDDINDPPRWVVGTVVIPYSPDNTERLHSALEAVRKEFE